MNIFDGIPDEDGDEVIAEILAQDAIDDMEAEEKQDIIDEIEHKRESR